jgi:hypothetical protein
MSFVVGNEATSTNYGECTLFRLDSWWPGEMCPCVLFFANVAAKGFDGCIVRPLCSFSNFASGQLWLALITFLYVDFFDATGTLFSMANFINNFIPGEDHDTWKAGPSCC